MPPKAVSRPKAVKRPTAVSRRRKPTPELAREIYNRLAKHYPDAHCALDFTSPFQLLVATILSAQCTDKRVNMVTPALFKRYRTPAALAAANPEELEELIKSTGFYRNKTKSLIGMSTAVAEQRGGPSANSVFSMTCVRRRWCEANSESAPTVSPRPGLALWNAKNRDVRNQQGNHCCRAVRQGCAAHGRKLREAGQRKVLRRSEVPPR